MKIKKAHITKKPISLVIKPKSKSRKTSGHAVNIMGITKIGD